MKRAAGTHGGEYAGPCPWCGGKDRFRVWPEQKGGRYWCRGCGKSGDTIQYLRDFKGLSFSDACHYLGRELGPRVSGLRPASVAWEPRETTAPSAAWQERARSFLDSAVAVLWSQQGAKIRQWLKQEKGLQDTIIEETSLGYNPADMYEPRIAWGLASSHKDDNTERRQWLPSGLVIPLVRGGEIHRLRIRREAPGDGARYVVISGSSSAPMTMHLDQAAMIIVESELDELLLNQEAGDLAGIVALGSAQAKPDRFTHEVLKDASLVLVSLDTDDAGAKASWRFWPTTYGEKVKRWPCINGKDASEAWANGLDVRAWVATGIFGTFDRYERFCIQTVDGGLSDVEAWSRVR